MKRLQKEKLYAKFKKCDFWLKEMSFLGHIINKNGAVVDPKKVKIVMGWLTPKNMFEIRSFLQLAGYYRRFVEGFSMIVGPLTRFTHKGMKYELDGKCECSFQLLKEKLVFSIHFSIANY